MDGGRRGNAYRVFEAGDHEGDEERGLMFHEVGMLWVGRLNG